MAEKHTPPTRSSPSRKPGTPAPPPSRKPPTPAPAARQPPPDRMTHGGQAHAARMAAAEEQSGEEDREQSGEEQDEQPHQVQADAGGGPVSRETGSPGDFLEVIVRAIIDALCKVLDCTHEDLARAVKGQQSNGDDEF